MYILSYKIKKIFKIFKNFKKIFSMVKIYMSSCSNLNLQKLKILIEYIFSKLQCYIYKNIYWLV